MYPNQPPQAPPPTPPQNPPQGYTSPQAPPPPMYIGQPPTPSELPSDYLNQIAPQAPKKQLFQFGLKQLILIGIALVVLVSVLAIIATNIGGSQKEPLQRLAVRLTATQAVVTSAQPNLKSSELRSLNSNLKLYMTNTNRDITPSLVAAGIETEKPDKKIVALESTATMSGRLEDARLNAVFDRTYAREMAYQLGTIMTLMSENYNSTSDPALKTFLKSAYDNLKPTQESFANFSALD